MLTAFALAAAVSIAEDCDRGDFARRLETATLYRVKASNRTHFYDLYDFKAGRHCPEGKPCRQAAYLVRGDIVAVSAKDARFACAWYAPPVGAKSSEWSFGDSSREGRPTLGLIPVDALEPVPIQSGRSAAAWNGEWVGDNQSLRILFRRGGRLAIDGDAGYARDAKAAASGAINVGQVEGQLFRSGELAEGVFHHDGSVTRPNGGDPQKEDGCLLRIRLLNSYLLVNDNGHCGGMNVSFKGLYRRAPKAR
ncbi:MAG TPA: hypothetical protein VEA44_15545 [Caulobacter sp.]|nr:hypothetical protein [Caulobacter sp.]